MFRGGKPFLSIFGVGSLCCLHIISYSTRKKQYHLVQFIIHFKEKPCEKIRYMYSTQKFSIVERKLGIGECFNGTSSASMKHNVIMLTHHEVILVTDALYLPLQCSQLIPQLLVLDNDGCGTLEKCRRGHRRDTKLVNVSACVCVCGGGYTYHTMS